jgi:hypothetical protein
MSKLTKAAVVFCAFALIAALLSACGADSSAGETTQAVSSVTTAKPPKHSIEGCLVRTGAKEATQDSQLSFLKAAQERDQVDKPGFVLDKPTRTLVQLWETSGTEGRVPEWAVWFGQPFGGELDPFEIVDQKPEGSFVVFVRDPAARQWKRLDGCSGRSS